MQNRILKSLEYVRQAVFQYPMMLLSAIIFQFAVQCLLDDRGVEEYQVLRLALTSSLGISLFFGLKMLGDRTGGQLYLALSGTLFLLAFYFFALPANEEDFTEVYAFLLIPVYILSHIFVAISPYLFKAKTTEVPEHELPNADGFIEENEELERNDARFWAYNKNLFVHICLTAIFSFVLAGGCTLAVIAIKHLFNMDLNEVWYFRIFFGVLILGSTLIFGIFNRNGLNELEQRSPYPNLLQFFTQFILIPLLLIYVCILYAYLVKIAIEWELPRGWVSYLVLAYAACGIFALLLVNPLLKSGVSKSWVYWFGKLFYYSLLPLLVLLFLAIFVRINAYGFTEARYFVLVLAIWITLISLYQILVRRASIKRIPQSLFAIGCLALCTPYLNVFQVSIRSQRSATLDLIADYNLLSQGKLDSNAKVPLQFVDELQNKYNYLAARQEEEVIEQWLSDHQRKVIQENSYNGFHSIFTNIDTNGEEVVGYVHAHFINQSKTLTIADYTQYFTIDEGEADFNIAWNGDSLLIRQEVINKHQHVFLESDSLVTDFIPLIEEWVDNQGKIIGTHQVPSISMPFAHGQLQGVINLKTLGVARDGNRKTFYFDRMEVFLR